jgi:uncharacterized membrane protein YphA (DoxX/SURF4 family)
MIMFLKNLSIMGGLLLLMVHGTKQYALRSFDFADQEQAHA